MDTNLPTNPFSRTVSISAKLLNKILVCPLCNCYFNNPYTILDCLHTFCESCISYYFRMFGNVCPLHNNNEIVTNDTTNAKLSTDPFKVGEIKVDRIISNIVSNIIISNYSIYTEKNENHNNDENHINDEHNESITITRKNKKHKIKKSHLSTKKTKKNKLKTENIVSISNIDDFITVELQPYDNNLDSLPILAKPFIKTSYKVSILQLKKYIALKLKLSLSNNNIDILCNNELLGNEFTLLFIYLTRWRHSYSNSKDLMLYYRKSIFN